MTAQYKQIVVFHHLRTRLLINLTTINLCQFIANSIYIYIKHFAWEDQREKECYIFHKVAKVENKALCGIYRTMWNI